MKQSPVICQIQTTCSGIEINIWYKLIIPWANVSRDKSHKTFVLSLWSGTKSPLYSRHQSKI